MPGRLKSPGTRLPGSRWASLSEREEDVLALVCMGKRNYQIAGILGIVNETV
jgi:DNA-binding CsgD family transcriptional regulator